MGWLFFFQGWRAYIVGKNCHFISLLTVSSAAGYQLMMYESWRKVAPETLWWFTVNLASHSPTLLSNSLSLIHSNLLPHLMSIYKCSRWCRCLDYAYNYDNLKPNHTHLYKNFFFLHVKKLPFVISFYVAVKIVCSQTFLRFSSFVFKFTLLLYVSTHFHKHR